MKIILVILLSLNFITGCAHAPKCGNPDGAKLVYTGKQTCFVRIRQVVIGSELPIPESLKSTELSDFNLNWIDPIMKDGQISLGHFVLTSQLNTDASPSPVKMVKP
jgi:hypothetical protein